MFDKRINIFAGHFGSGKTEVAVNYAMKMKDMNKKVAIVDLDIVNPFFRTADMKEKFEEKGIKAILPVYANTNVDVPALPAEINIVFEQKSYECVIDVGGDDLGARALSRYRSQIEQEAYNLYMVINILRPMTETAEKILKMLDEIQTMSNLKVTGFVNNTNLLMDTEADQIIEGQKVIDRVSEITGIPVAFTACMDDIYDDVKKLISTEVFVLNKNILLPWQVQE